MTDREHVNDLCRQFRDLEDEGQYVDVSVFCDDHGIEDPNVVKQLRNRLETMVVSDSGEDETGEDETGQDETGQDETGEDDAGQDEGERGESVASSESQETYQSVSTAESTAAESSLSVAGPRREPPARSFRQGMVSDPALLDGLTSEAHYDSFEPLAAGGLGEVFTADHIIGKKFSGMDADRKRRVAIKLIRLDKVDAKKLRMFMAESAITAKLEHPGVVPVYGFGRTKDRPFYVMRLVKGQNMKERIHQFHAHIAPGGGLDGGENSVAFRELLNHFISVCNTLAYAHDCGIIHRDVKPENVMLGPFGETLVVDWGLARTYIRTSEEKEESGLPTLIQETKDRNFSEGIEGTPNYLSPEQADPLSYVGRPTDIYSLGATLYEILTGRLAVEGNDLAEVLNIVRTNSIRPARDVNKLVPKPLDAICQKAMARRGEDRYRSALDLAEDIKRYLANEPVTAYQEPPAQLASRWIRRNRGWSLAGGALALVTLVTIACVMAMGRVNDRNMLRANLAGLRTQADKQEELLRNDIKRLREDVRFLANNPEVAAFAQACEDTARRDALKEQLLAEIESDKRYASGAAAVVTEAASSDDVEQEQDPLEQLRDQRRRLADAFKMFVNREPSYMQARIIDREGIELLRVERKKSGEEISISKEMADKAGKSYVVHCMNTDGIYLSEFNVNQEHGVRDFKFPVVRACMKLSNGKGMVVINMHFSRLAAFISGKDSDAKGGDTSTDDDDNNRTIVYLTNQRGEFLIHQEQELDFSFERELPYRARDVYRPLAKFLSEDKQTLEQVNVIPRCSIFIKPATHPVTWEQYAILKEHLGRVYEKYDITAEASKLDEEDNSCHGIITGVDEDELDGIIGILQTEEFDKHFKVMRLPTTETTEKHTVYCRKIKLKSDDKLESGDRFLTLVLAKPNPRPRLTSRLIRMIFGDE